MSMDMQLPPVDFAGASERLGLGDDFYKQMLDIFIEETPGKLSGIRQALARGDGRTLERTAHSIKGSASNLGVEGMRALTAQIELLAKAGRLAETLPLLDAADGELQRVAQTITTHFGSSSPA
jgi:HPt (histidine-containing phosphotransfer) domain-containing protein